MDAAGTVVVTGAGGFAGRALVAFLAARGGGVRGLVRALDGAMAARAEFLPVGDLAEIDERTAALALGGAAAVVHLAARVHRPGARGDDEAAAMRRSNVATTQRIARAAAAAGVAHFVFASTVKVNGEITQPGHPFRESEPPDPHDAYAASKWEAEQALAAIAADTGMRVTALRLPLTYGPGAKGNFAALARAVRAGVPLPFAGIVNRRSVLGLANLCDAIAAVLGSDARDEHGRAAPYFVADAAPVATPELARALAHAMGVAPRLFAVPPGLLRFVGAFVGRAAAVERLVGSLEVDTSAFRARFAWSPPRTLAEGLADTFADGQHVPGVIPRSERDEGSA